MKIYQIVGNWIIRNTLIRFYCFQGIGEHAAATQVAKHSQRALLQATTAAGIPAPAVTVPNVNTAPT